MRLIWAHVKVGDEIEAEPVQVGYSDQRFVFVLDDGRTLSFDAHELVDTLSAEDTSIGLEAA